MSYLNDDPNFIKNKEKAEKQYHNLVWRRKTTLITFIFALIFIFIGGLIWGYHSDVGIINSLKASITSTLMTSMFVGISLMFLAILDAPIEARYHFYQNHSGIKK